MRRAAFSPPITLWTPTRTLFTPTTILSLWPSSPKASLPQVGSPYVFDFSANCLVEGDSELAAQAYGLLNLAGKLALQNALAGEAARNVQANFTSVVGMRVATEDLGSTNVSVQCNESTAFNYSLTGKSYCDSLRFRFFATPLGGSQSTGKSLNNLSDSRFGSGNAVDITSVISFLNIGNKMSPLLGVTVYNLSSAWELPLNRSYNFLELQLPFLSQRYDQASLPSDNLTCAYFSESSNSWPTTGCTRVDSGSVENRTSAMCICSHLTLFVLDITAAKQAVSCSNANILLNGVNGVTDGDLKRFVGSFIFWLILLLLLFNLLSIYLHRVDLANKRDGRFFTQKYAVLKAFFPEPREGSIDFFANNSDGFSKEDALQALKESIGMHSSQKEDSGRPIVPPLQTSPVARFDTQRQSLEAVRVADKSADKDKAEEIKCDFKDNPEEAQSRQELVTQPRSPGSPVGSHSPSFGSPKSSSSGGSNNSRNGNSELRPGLKTGTTRFSPTRLRRSTLFSATSVYNSAAFSRSPPRVEEGPTISDPQTPAFPTKESVANNSRVLLNVPQYSLCAFFRSLWLAIKMQYPLVALFTFFNPAFPRPLRLLQTTTRIIGYMGVSAIFYNTNSQMRSSNESIYVALISSGAMVAISSLLASLFFVDSSIAKGETNMNNDVERNLERQMDMMSLQLHFFTMKEYYGMIIERKRELYSELVVLSKGLCSFKRLLGILLSYGFSVFFLIFFLVFYNTFDDELIKVWTLSVVYSLLLDIVGTQLLKVAGVVVAVASMQRLFRTSSAHGLCAGLMTLLGLDYY